MAGSCVCHVMGWSHRHTLSHTQTLTHTLMHSLSHTHKTHTHTHNLSHTLSLSLSLSLTHTNTHTHTVQYMHILQIVRNTAFWYWYWATQSGSPVYVFRCFGWTVHVMACRWRQQALFEMWADFYQTSPGMHPDFLVVGVGGEVADSEWSAAKFM